ncbi:MAG: DUF1987 domain-containing protein [Verrucomicrobiota bacterium]
MMSDLIIEPDTLTPRVHLDAAAGKITIDGESYPDSAGIFYSPVFEWVQKFIAEEKRPLELHLKLTYFNTGTAKCVMDLLELLENYVRNGNRARAFWHYQEEDEDMQMSGEEFAEDVTLDFTFVSH